MSAAVQSFGQRTEASPLEQIVVAEWECMRRGDDLVACSDEVSSFLSSFCKAHAVDVDLVVSNAEEFSERTAVPVKILAQYPPVAVPTSDKLSDDDRKLLTDLASAIAATHWQLSRFHRAVASVENALEAICNARGANWRETRDIIEAGQRRAPDDRAAKLAALIARREAMDAKYANPSSSEPKEA